jgi:hypothetical protein
LARRLFTVSFCPPNEDVVFEEALNEHLTHLLHHSVRHDGIAVRVDFVAEAL